MPGALRTLIVEDVEANANLLVRALERGGFNVTYTRVASREELNECLERGPWDVVLADYNMPGLGALGALGVIRERRLDLPFIVTSSSISEEGAVVVLRAGAHDFLLKEQLARLVPAVERELREAQHRAERSALQEQLMLSDRLASMGLLAASMAHELNNPLAAAMANLDMALEELSGEANPDRIQRLAGSLFDTREALEHVRQIVADVKMFSRRGEPREPGCLDIHSVIDSAVRIVRNSVLSRVKLVKNYGVVPPVRGVASRLGQVFLNILINAADALPKRNGQEGEIRVATRVSDNQAEVVVEVVDTGQGIPAQYLPRIFDPFFTTKADGEGTGLGLAIALRIVQELGGTITVESEVGVGTMVRVRLPTIPGATLPVAPAGFKRAEKPQEQPRFRRRSVLIVDDEEHVRAALGRGISRDHRVVLADSGAEVLGLVALGQSFDLILCDLWMPGLSGMELHAQLSQVSPAHAERMVFLTGGAFTAEVARFLSGGRLYLEKPIPIDQLRQFVNARLIDQ